MNGVVTYFKTYFVTFPDVTVGGNTLAMHTSYYQRLETPPELHMHKH